MAFPRSSTATVRANLTVGHVVWISVSRSSNPDLLLALSGSERKLLMHADFRSNVSLFLTVGFGAATVEAEYKAEHSEL